MQAIRLKFYTIYSRYSFCKGGFFTGTVYKPSMHSFESFQRELGLNIKKIRTAKGRTQEWMDDKQEFGIDIKHYQNIEQGRANITLKTIYKICRKLEIEPAEIFENTKCNP